jgi:hypothetical protein
MFVNFVFLSDAVLRYSRGFLLDCAKSRSSQTLPANWVEILLEHPYLEPKVDDEPNDDKPTHARRLSESNERVSPILSRRLYSKNNYYYNNNINVPIVPKHNMLIDPRPNLPTKTWDPESNKWIDQGPQTRS